MIISNMYSRMLTLPPIARPYLEFQKKQLTLADTADTSGQGIWVRQPQYLVDVGSLVSLDGGESAAASFILGKERAVHK